MRNIHSINDFKKLFEADKFASDVSFSDSLIGRGFNSLFKILRKSANKGRLIFFKRKLENEYIKALLDAVKDEDVMKLINSKEDVEIKREQIGEQITEGEDPLEAEIGEEILMLPLPKEAPNPDMIPEDTDFGEEEKPAITAGEETDTGEEVDKEKPLVFTRYNEWVKIINSMSENATEDDVKVIKKIKSELEEIGGDIYTALAWYKSIPTFNNPKAREYKRLRKENDIFEKEQQYVNKLISACDSIINKYKVEDEISDEEYSKLIASVEQKALPPKKKTDSTTNIEPVKTKVETTPPTPDDGGATAVANTNSKVVTVPGEQLIVGGKSYQAPSVEVQNNRSIYNAIDAIFNKLIKALPPEKHKKLKSLRNKAFMKVHPDKEELGQTNDINVLTDFYNSLKTIESVLFTYENNKFRDFTIDQKLDEAEMILERSNKNSRKLNKNLTKLSDVTGNNKFGDLDLDQLDDKKMKEAFAKNPKLIAAATSKVNKEAIKDIEYSARLIYNPNVSISNTILKNFKNNEADAKQYEAYWKKMVSKVKKEFHGLLDLDAVDPLKLVNDEETARGATGGKVSAKASAPTSAVMVKLKEQENLDLIQKMGILTDKKPDTKLSTVSHALIETAITTPEVQLHYLLVDVFLTDDNKVMFRIVKMYDGVKIVKAGEKEIKQMPNFDKLQIDDKSIIDLYKFGKDNIYYQRKHSTGKLDAKLNNLTVYKDDISTKNHFGLFEFNGKSIQPINKENQIPILGYFAIKHDTDIEKRWGITDQTQKEIKIN